MTETCTVRLFSGVMPDSCEAPDCGHLMAEALLSTEGIDMAVTRSGPVYWRAYNPEAGCFEQQMVYPYGQLAVGDMVHLSPWISLRMTSE